MNRPSGIVVTVVTALVLAAQIGTAADPPGGKQRSPFRGRSGPSASKRPARAGGLVIPTEPVAKSELPAAVRRQRTESPMEVAPIDRARRAAVAERAAAIDALIDASLTEADRAAREPLDDALFVRRVHLALGGRIPTLAETVTFLGSKDPDKHTTLIDDLLESPDWVSQFYNTWAGTLRLVDHFHFVPQVEAFDPYCDWVKRAIAENRPYDEWVRELLTADGKIWTNPAVGYQLRDNTMPLPYVDHTVRVFLGTRVGCAECHDHPSEPWTRRIFYELAAFTAGTRTRPEFLASEAKTEANENWAKAMEEFNRRNSRIPAGQKPLDPVAGAFLNRHLFHVRLVPFDLKMPDGDTGATESVSPRVPWGEIPPNARSLDPRSQLASWVTDRTNRQFARTIANRLWKFCFGAGIVEPIDDFRDSNPPSNPPLLEHLADLIVELGFDQREFVRIVVSTAAWRNRAIDHDPQTGESHRFAAPLLRRMSAEQVWDSYLTLMCRDIWSYQRPAFESFAWIGDFDFADGPDFDSAYAMYERYVRLREDLRKDHFERCGYRGRLGLARASETPAPADSRHPVRLFGQGDRLAIDGGRSVATLPQILMLWKSDATEALLDDGSLIMETIAANDPGIAIEIMFLSVLSRRPRESDRTLIAPYLEKAPRRSDACRDILWSMLNTREFLFVQ